MKLIVEGRVDTSGKVALDNGMFNACVMIGDQVVGQAQVSADGEYKVEFKSEGMPETLELKILPCSVKSEDAGKMALTRRFSSSLFAARVGKPGEFVLSEKFFLPVDYLDFIRRRTRKYNVHGTVYLEHPTYFSALPGCRIDFYEVDFMGEYPKDSPLIDPGLAGIIRRKDFLGSAYTRADGSYDFHFNFGALPSKPGLPFPEVEEFAPHLPPGVIKPGFPIDYRPDIRANFHLFINGAWTRIYSAPMIDCDWNIGPDYHRDYRIPADAASGAVEPGTKPATGFRFKTIGLFPIDVVRIVDGYAHSQTGDPLTGITHEPFCGTLRIYGLFAASPAVSTYTVELLKTDATGTAMAGESWIPLGDPLTNLKRNDTADKWDSMTLGPTAGKYQNVDIEDPMEWLEPSLKAVWNSANCVNGCYKLRITGYDASDTVVFTSEMPMIRIDNDLPQASLDVISPVATTCGDLTIGADRNITFQVTAYDSDGHLHSYYIYGTRGRYAESAGDTVNRTRPVADADWDGIISSPEPFAVAVRSSTTIVCATMAYSFHLCVQGAGTNGYANCLESKRVWKEINLVVTE